MEINIGTRLKHAWNAFLNRDPTANAQYYGPSSFYRPDRPRLPGGNERSIVTSIFNRIALDVASVDIRHCKVNSEGQYLEDIKSDLNNCLTLEPNIDQGSKAFKIDMVMSMLGEGVIEVELTEFQIDSNIDFAIEKFSTFALYGTLKDVLLVDLPKGAKEIILDEKISFSSSKSTGQ